MTKSLFRRKGFSFFLLFLIYSLLFPWNISALPEGEEVVAGDVEVDVTDPNTMDIHQGSNKAVINWDSFSIDTPETVNFLQPSSTASALNRVIGVDPSLLYGQLNANGRVFLINPNGILVGPTGILNVNSFLASTLDMSNEDYLAGNYIFSSRIGDSLSSILNQGNISVASGGFVSLLSPAVENQGTIMASLGKVFIGAGEKVTLNFAENDLISFAVDESVLSEVTGPDGNPVTESIKNTGSIYADGGQVIISAKTAYDAIKSVVNNTGFIRANTVGLENGKIVLRSTDRGVVENSGTLMAMGEESGETGGSIDVLGDKVGLFDGSAINVSGDSGGGSVRIGGDFQGDNPDILNASRTYVGSDTTITADAFTEGDGGTVIVWADETTRFYGDISATGGDISGDGGFAEVSGSYLDFNGNVDLSAIGGAAGTLLLDPDSITVTNGGTETDLVGSTGNDSDPNKYAFAEDAGSDVTMDADVITGILDGGTSVTLQAHDDITVDENIDGSGSTTPGGGLTLQAGDDINVNANILTNNGEISLIANDPGATPTGSAEGTGDITMGNNDSIDAGNQNITLSAEGNVTVEDLTTTGTITITSTSGLIQEVSNGTLDGATISLTANSDIGASGSNITTANVTNLSLNANGNIYVDGTSALTDLTIAVDPSTNSDSTYSVTGFTGTTLVLTDSGANLDLGANTLPLNFDLTAKSGNITDSGAVDITGTSSFTTQGCYIQL